VRGVGKVFKGAGKAIKKVVKSKAFKYVAAAALIYVGGAALGAWNAGGPLSAINGTLAGGAKASTGAEMLASGGAGAGTGAAAGAATGGTVNVAGVGAGAGATTSQVAGGTLNLGSLGAEVAGGSTVAGSTAAGGTLNLGSLAAPAAADAATVGSAAAGTAATAAAPTGFSSSLTSAGTDAANLIAESGIKKAVEEVPKGIISRLMDGVGSAGTFMKENPMPTAMLLSAAGSAASPDEIDIIREQQNQKDQYEQRERERRSKNMDFAGIKLNMEPSNKPLTDLSGNQVFGNNGIINRARG